MTNTDLLLNLAPERLVQVALERGIDRYPDGLTYAAPEALGPLFPGDRVVVPLGRGNAPTSGWVLAVHYNERRSTGMHLPTRTQN